MLEITTFGRIDIQIDGKQFMRRVDLRRVLLLAYLVERRGPQPRGLIAELLWPNVSHESALHRLRQLLVRMRKEGFGPYVTSDRTTVGLNASQPIACDLNTLRQITQNLEQASFDDLLKTVTQTKRMFLGNIPLDDFPELSHWAASLRYESQVLWIEAAFQLIPQLLARGMSDDALEVSAYLTECLPYDNQAELLHLTALSACGHHAEAFRHLNAFRQILASEMPDHSLSPELEAFGGRLNGAMPSSAFSSLKQAASTDEETSRTEAHANLAGNALHLAVPSQELFGRNKEAEQLATLLENRHRLISIVGLGGMGKTFFVRSQIPALAQRVGNDVYFIDLRSNATRLASEVTEHSVDGPLLTVLASTLNLRPAQGQMLFEQLARWLRARTCILILDNFESMIDEAKVVAKLIDQVPTLMVLVTSRERLNLRRESLLRLDRLAAYDPSDAKNELTSPQYGSALQLFERMAQRRQPNFQLNEDNGPIIALLCEQLGGLPLAIELAAIQLDYFTIPELIQATAQSYEILKTTAKDVDPGQASIQTVLSTMWQRLSPEATAALAGLTVFATSWTFEIMKVVVPASPQVYDELLNSSLLQTVASGEFTIHPLVKQHAKENSPTIYRSAEKHAAYFLKQLELGERLWDETLILDESTFSQLQRYQADLRIAWRWAVENDEGRLLRPALISFGHFLNHSGQMNEGIELLQLWFDKVSKEAEADVRVLGQIAASISRLFMVSGDLAASREWGLKATNFLKKAGTLYEQIAVTILCYRIKMYLFKGSGMADTHLDETLDDTLIKARSHGYYDLYFRGLMYVINDKLQTGRWQEAKVTLDEGLSVDKNKTNTAELILASINLHVCCCYFGMWDQVEEYVQTLQRQVNTMVHVFASIMVVYLDSLCQLHKGNFRDAIERMEIICEKCYSLWPEQASLYAGFLACSQAQAGHNADALATAQQSLAHAKELGGDYLIAYAKLHLAYVMILSDETLILRNGNGILLVDAIRRQFYSTKLAKKPPKS